MKHLFTLFIGLSCFQLIVAQTPTADEIIETYLELIGGAEQWKALENIRMEGSSAKLGVEFPIVMITARTNKLYTEIEVRGKGVIKTLF